MSEEIKVPKRFKAALTCGYWPNNPEPLVRSSNGAYVAYADYLKLKKELAEKTRELEEVRGDFRQAEKSRVINANLYDRAVKERDQCKVVVEKLAEALAIVDINLWQLNGMCRGQLGEIVRKALGDYEVLKKRGF